MKKLILSLAGVTLLFGGINAKKVLDHSSFDDWKSVKITPLSRDGNWSAFQVNPQEGDGVLTIRNTRTGKEIVVNRGYNPSFTADSRWAVALIKPHYSDTRKAKIDKKKDFDMPQDSLAIVDLKTGRVELIPSVISYKVGEDGGNWLAYLSCDTTLISTKALGDKEAGRPLVVRDLNSSKSKVLKWVREYVMSKSGKRVAATMKHHSSDSVATDGIGVLSLPDTSFILLDRDKKFYGTPAFNEEGTKLAYTLSNDSLDSGTKRADLFLADLTVAVPEPEQIFVRNTVNVAPHLQRPHNPSDPEAEKVALRQWADAMAKAAGDSIFINQYSVPQFSHNGKRLIIGMAPAVAPNDTTIVDFERAELDIWRWDAPLTPPQENVQVEELRKKLYPMVIDLASSRQTLLSSNPLETVDPGDRWDADVALVRDPSEDVVSQQWDYIAPEQLYIVNVNNGSRKKVAKHWHDEAKLSPDAKYVYWFADRDYYVYDIAGDTIRNVSKDIEFPLWNEDQDVPLERQAYGDMGWIDGDQALLVYDRHDIWSLDPQGKRAAVNLTKGEGRKLNCRYRYQQTDPEERGIKTGSEALLRVFDYGDKRHGIATLKIGTPAVPVLRTLEENTFTQITKAKDVPVFAFQKSNFSTSPDVYIARDYNFAKAQKVSDANPQMKDYSWGDAQLVKWYAYNGKLTEGVLYTPEDLDPTKKYPMLVVFYETNSEELYRHYTMEPSWSWVNYPFYVSRGYVVFVPDVHYAPGIPGESAYNYICSGVEDLCKKYEWIDKDRIGIDGQSWGGYQTAFLVTRTNMFACAGSGAPVSNMTSAFGGIRWGTGDSRMGQYEQGQSRIGRNLWEAPELYIANSPIFHADRCNTPLLIMHNDADGAVPWYQGIELFMGLRRLHKPVWMLQYNGEAHNIKARKNRKDITIRLQQFFDHYLKGDPMPKWMKEGIPATRKGQEMGTELIEEPSAE